MLKAVKKQIPINVVQINSSADMPNRVHWHFTGDEQFPLAVFNKSRQEWQQLKVGDYLNITNREDVYPIAKTYFDEHYDVVSE